MTSEKCDCCGGNVDGLFPILGSKREEDDKFFIATWCGLCWEIGSCKGPHGGACYRHEYDEQWNALWEAYDIGEGPDPTEDEELARYYLELNRHGS